MIQDMLGIIVLFDFLDDNLIPVVSPGSQVNLSESSLAELCLSTVIAEAYLSDIVANDDKVKVDLLPVILLIVVFVFIIVIILGQNAADSFSFSILLCSRQVNFRRRHSAPVSERLLSFPSKVRARLAEELSTVINSLCFSIDVLLLVEHFHDSVDVIAVHLFILSLQFLQETVIQVLVLQRSWPSTQVRSVLLFCSIGTHLLRFK